MWINHFARFEQHPKSNNRLELGFYNPSGKTVAIHVPSYPLIPAIIKGEGRLISLLENIEKIGLEDNIEEIRRGDKNLVTVRVPHNLDIVSRLPEEFQTKNWLKHISYQSLFPEQKVELSYKMESFFDKLSDFSKGKLNEIEVHSAALGISALSSFSSSNRNYDITLNNLYDFDFTGKFLTTQEKGRLTRLYLDIEKMLWLDDEQEEVYEEWKKAKKEGDEESIQILEEKLTIEHPRWGNISLLDPRLSNEITAINLKWDPSKKREIYVLDKTREWKKDKFEGYDIKRFDNEREMLSEFREEVIQINPYYIIAHNIGFDVPNIRKAFEKLRMMFDPGVPGIQPISIQAHGGKRIRQSAIWIDTISKSKLQMPWLIQRSIHGGYKLSNVSKKIGFPFVKKYTYPQLKDMSYTVRLSSDEKERIESLEKQISYGHGDIPPLVNLAEEEDFWELQTQLKTAMPFLTES